MQVIVIGTSHQYQFGGTERSADQNAEFDSLIRRACDQWDVRCIGEEMSKDALDLKGRTASTLALIADELGLKHVYCDPTEVEQKSLRLGVERNANGLRHFGWTEERIQEEVAREHRVREGFWLSYLRTMDVWPCLFVCGSEHARPFVSLLQSSGFEVELLAERWDA